MNTLTTGAAPPRNLEDELLNVMAWPELVATAPTAPSLAHPPVFRPLMLSMLLGKPNPQQRREGLYRALQDLGFDALNILLAETMDGSLVPVSSLGALPGPSWPELYLRSKHYEVDPRLQDVSGTGLPRLWDMGSLRLDTLEGLQCERAERFLRDIYSTGTRSGVLFSLRTGSGSTRRLVGFHSRNEGLAWMTDAIVGQALMLAVFAVEHCTAMPTEMAEEPDVAALTDLHRSILHCLQLGMGDKVIADRLGMSTYNVDYHLRKLRLRFGVRNRVQLIQAVQCALLP